MPDTDLNGKNSLPGTKRIEALADGIFAIAMTLLVLNLSFPLVESSPQSLLKMLSGQVADFLSYGLSFILLAIFWIMHHQQFHYIQSTDSKHLWINIFILMFVALVPFSTSIIGDYGVNMIADVFFSSNILIIGFLFLINWVYATGKCRLVSLDLDRQIIVRTVWRISVIPIVSLLAIIVSLFSPFGSVWLFILIPIIQFLKPFRYS
ncbi:MAG: TMEM175 family protein [Chloroflexi bacterium]|nr:TMEM175 family protein [Chloroflexota bacterium]